MYRGAHSFSTRPTSAEAVTHEVQPAEPAVNSMLIEIAGVAIAVFGWGSKPLPCWPLRHTRCDGISPPHFHCKPWDSLSL